MAFTTATKIRLVTSESIGYHGIVFGIFTTVLSINLFNAPRAKTMIIERRWAMPSKHTFTIKPIRELLREYVRDDLIIVDPFAGFNSVGNITNDLNPKSPAIVHMDALDFCKDLQTAVADIVLYDPPYSYRQVKELYESIGLDKFDPKRTRMDYWSDIRTELARICKPNGRAFCFGWNTTGLGLKRGFRMERILLVPHGGARNDTIVTLEIKQ